MQETGSTLFVTKTKLPVAVGVATILLVIASDLLIFDAEPGINLFVMAFAIALTTALFAARRQRFDRGILGLATAVIFALPLIEAPSLLGLGLAALGLSLAALIAARLMPGRLEQMPVTVVRFLLPAPTTFVRDAKWLGVFARQHSWQRAIVGLLSWIVPLGLGFVFVLLFAAANPLIEVALSALRADSALDLFNPVRFVFWLIMAAAIWAVLRPKLLRRRNAGRETPMFAHRETAWFGQSAIRRSLIIFNALFAIETALDIAFLWGGMTLPNGMTHAEYAHRGAYPLIVTALLAGAFVLVAMRKQGPSHKSVVIRSLVYAFIAQNVLLCLSAILRLELYVEVYSLTEMRLAAGIWMALVAAGLVFILLRIWWDKSNSWLVACNLVALIVVLYGAALMDFSAVIARFNMDHSAEISGTGLPLDFDYLEELGPSAIPTVDLFIRAQTPNSLSWNRAQYLREQLEFDFRRAAADWRSWSWRTQRLVDYLSSEPVASAAPTLQNNTMGLR